MEIQSILNSLNEDFSISIQIPNNLSKNDLDDLLIFLKIKFSSIINKKINRALEANIDTDVLLDLKYCNHVENKTELLYLSNFFQFNSWVKVCSNTYDQFLKMPISNLIGRIIDFYNDGENDVFYIEWSSTSLEHLTDSTLRKCIRKKVTPFGTFIESDLVLPVNYTENIQKLKQNQINLFKPYIPDKFELEYNAVFNLQSSSANLYPDQIWANYFENVLYNEKEIDLFFNDQPARLITITGSDEKNGIWVEVESESKRYIRPLNEFTNISTPGFIKQVFNFYLFWSTYFFRSED